MAAVPAAVGRPAGGALHAFAVAVETGAGLEIPAIAAVALEGAERHDGIGVAAGAAIPVHRLAVRGVFENAADAIPVERSEEHTSELQSLMRISYAVFCLKKKKRIKTQKKQ